VKGQNGTTPQKRLRILDDAEIDALYGRPCFTPDDRQLFFTLTQPEKETLELLRSVPAQISFILQLGYFKAKSIFFSFSFGFSRTCRKCHYM